MIQIGEATGNLDENLVYISEYYEEEVTLQIGRPHDHHRTGYAAPYGFYGRLRRDLHHHADLFHFREHMIT